MAVPDIIVLVHTVALHAFEVMAVAGTISKGESFLNRQPNLQLYN